nr:ABC transporter permease subunit [Campylobacter sp.]
MLKVDKVRYEQNVFFYTLDYFWGALASLGVISVLVGLWQLGAEFVNSELILPSPLVVFDKAIEILQNFKANELDISLQRAFVGILLGSFLGILAGLIAGAFKTSMAILKPINLALLGMPNVIWVVLAVFWFSFGTPSTLVVIVLTILPLTFSNSALGMMSVNEDYKEVFDAYKLGLNKKIRYLYIPALTPFVLGALSMAFSLGVKVVVLAELLGAND